MLFINGKKFLKMSKQKKRVLKRSRDVVYVTPKSQKRNQILMEKIIIGVYWYEDEEDGLIHIDEEGMSQEFENELEQIIFLSNCKP